MNSSLVLPLLVFGLAGHCGIVLAQSQGISLRSFRRPLVRARLSIQ